VTTTIEILLIDNGPDGTAEFVADKFPQVRIIPSAGNVGFAGGNNILARHARAPYLLLLNPDLYVAPGAIDSLLAGAVRYPAAAAWGGVTTFLNGEPDTGNAIAIPSLAELASSALGVSIAGRGNPVVDRDVEVEVLSGGFVMLSRAAWDRVAGFDERFFLYCEEVDLFQRLRRMGFPLWRIAVSRGAHEMAHGNNLTARRLLFRTAGTIEYLRKHWSLPARMTGAALIWLGAIERYLAGKVFGRRKPGLARLGEAYRLVAMRPGLWIHGYDAERGLLASMVRGRLED
jgi:GT2 family glycosyltransferase